MAASHLCTSQPSVTHRPTRLISVLRGMSWDVGDERGRGWLLLIVLLSYGIRRDVLNLPNRRECDRMRYDWVKGCQKVFGNVFKGEGI